VSSSGRARHAVRAAGRLALYGSGAARLHEEIYRLRYWTEAARDRRPLAGGRGVGKG